MNTVWPGRESSSTAPPMRVGQLPGDREPEPRSRRPGALEPAEPDEDPLLLVRRDALARHLRPGARRRPRRSARQCRAACGGARCRRAPGRSGAPARGRRARRPPSSTSTSQRMLEPARDGREFLAAGPRRPSASSTGSCSSRIGPASSRERSSRSVASFESRSTCSVIVSRNSRRVASSRSSSRKSSRKPPSEKIGVRSSCEALAMNSRRASSRRASRRRIRSKAAASSPSSSRPRSSTGCVEIAGGDPLGGAFQPANPAREHRRGAETREYSGPEPRQARPEQPGLDELDVFERRAERARRRGGRRPSGPPPPPRHSRCRRARRGPSARPGRRPPSRRPDPVRRPARRADGRSRRSANRAQGERPVVDDPRHGPAGGLVDEVLVWQGLRRLGLPEHAAGGARSSESRPATSRRSSVGTSATQTTARAPSTTTASARLSRAPTLGKGSPAEPVADASHRLDQLGIAELLAQMAHVDVDRPRLPVGVVAPERPRGAPAGCRPGPPWWRACAGARTRRT